MLSGRSWFDELVYAPAFAAAAHLLEKQCNFARGMGSHAAHDEPVRAPGVYPFSKILSAEMIRFFPLLRFTFGGALRSSRRAAVSLRVRRRSRRQHKASAWKDIS